MPGIVGFITENPDQQAGRSRLAKMLGCMLHSPSYSHGTSVLPAQGCYLGWVGHEGSYTDCNPIVGRQGEVVLVFAGEHFPRDGACVAARARPHSADRLLTLYEHFGERFVNELNGWFAGVLVDLQKSLILLFNDRFGVHRIYWHQTSDSITFASEAKSVLSVCPETRALDSSALGHYLGFGTVFNDRTLFAGVSLLPGASCWSVAQPRAITKRRYFDPQAWIEQETLGPDDFYAQLRHTLGEILPKYFNSTEPVGVSLTGGLDTRLVMAGLPKDAGPIPCYTYAGVYRECYDVKIARQIARACGQPYHVLSLGTDFFQDFATFAEQTVWLTDGCLDLSGSHEVYFSRLARQLSPVRLTGNYGSEILRSVSTFKFNPPPRQLLTPDVLPAIDAAAAAHEQLRRDHPVTFAGFAEVPWHLFGRLAAAQSQLVLRSPYMDNELLALLYRAPPSTRETTQTSLRLIADMSPDLAGISTDMGYGGRTPAPLAGLRRIFRYLQFKAEWYYNAGMPDWMTPFDKTPVIRVMEPLFVGSHKIEHYRRWFQNELKDYVQSLLADSQSYSRAYLDSWCYGAMVSEHARGRGNHLNEINRLATLELVQRLLMSRNYDA